MMLNIFSINNSIQMSKMTNSGLFKLFFLPLFLLLTFAQGSFGQVTTIVSEGFNNTSSLFSVTGTVVYKTGNSASGDRPSSSPLFSEGTHGLSVSNKTVTLTSSSINTALYEEINLTMNLASFSVNSSGNGADAGDTFTISISSDNGTSYRDVLMIKGNSNACWGFSDALKKSVDFAGTTVVTTFTPDANLNTDKGFGNLEILNLPSVSNLKVKIAIVNDNNNELFVIDNFQIKGKLKVTCAAPTNASILTTTSTPTTASISMIAGTGDKRMVVMKEGSAVSGMPTSSGTYIANSVFELGSTLGTGEYVVYNETGTTANITDLKCNTTYHVKVYEYNSTDNCYASGTTTSFTTLKPEIISSLASLSGFEYVAGLGPSTSQSFTVSASNLNPSVSTINLSLNNSNFELSTDNTTFSSTLSLPYIAGALTATTIYTRLKDGLANGDKLSTLTVTYASTGTNCGDSKTISLSGKVFKAEPTTHAGSFTCGTTTPTTIPLTWTASTGADGYLIKWSDVSYASIIDPVDGTNPTTAGTGTQNSTSASATISGLTQNKTYYFKIYPYSNSGVNTNYLTSGSVSQTSCTTQEGPCVTEMFTTGLSNNGYASGNETLSSGVWNFVDAIRGTNSSNGVSGNNLQLKASTGKASTPSSSNGFYYSEIKFHAKSTSNVSIEYSLDNGSSWNTQSSVSASGYQIVNFGTLLVNKIRISVGSSVTYIDNVEIFCKASCTSPTTLATASTVSAITNSTATLNWTNGTGTNRIVVMQEDLATTDIPVNGTAYAANAIFGTEEFLNEQYTVYNSTGSTVNVSGLKCGATYHYSIFEYNSTGNCYNSTPLRGSFTTTSTQSMTVGSYTPNSGPAGTIVTVTGSGFNTATTGSYGMANTTDSLISSTVIEVQIPLNAVANDNISLLDVSGCAVNVGTFTLINTVETGCEGVSSGGSALLNDLILFEIFDMPTKDPVVITIYNGTNQNKDLADYRIYRNGDINLPSSVYSNYMSTTNPLSGILAPGETAVIGFNNSCSNISLTGNGNLSAGINQNDGIQLRKADGVTVVDVLHTPNYAGFFIQRDVNFMQPSTVFNNAHWTTQSITGCPTTSNYVGTPPVITTNIPTITTQPQTINLSCHATSTVYTVVGAEGHVGGNSLAYQWYSLTPGANTWTEITTNGTSASLTVDPIVENTQYYVQVRENTNTCYQSSHAVRAQVDNATKRYYKSISNGDWTDAAIWEMSDDNVTFIPACTYPVAANSSAVWISAGTNVNLAIDLSIDRLTIVENGTLEVGINSKLTISDSITGPDFIVNGTFMYRSTSGKTLEFLNSATWQLGANATIIKTNSADAANLRDKFEGGMATIPSTANWKYRYTNDGDVVTGSEGFFYPNLSFENTTGTNYSWNSLNTALSGASGYTTVKGNLEIGVHEVGTVSVSNINTNSQPMLVFGNTEINTGSSLNTNTINGVAGTGFELKGDLLVNGTLNVTDGTLERVVRFTGSTDQNISGIGILSLYKMTVNKSAGTIELNRNVTVQNNLTMLSGSTYTNANVLELGTSSMNLGTLSYTSGFVVGKMKRWFTGTSTSDVNSLFPMGEEVSSALKNRFARIQYTTAPTTGGDLTVEFISSAMGSAGLPIDIANSGGFGKQVDNSESQGFWRILAGTVSGGQYTSKLTGEGFPVTALADVTLLKRDNTATNWLTPGNHVLASGTLAMPTVERTNLVGFSEFGFGYHVVNPLPVELSSMSATCVENKEVKLAWKTASELNNKKFIIEKWNQNQSWDLIGEVTGQGNTSIETAYTWIDRELSLNEMYYRIIQEDFNGQREVYPALSVHCEPVASISITPNPARTKVMVTISSEEAMSYNVTLMSTDGKVIAENITSKELINAVVFDVNHLASGVYFVTMKAENGKVEIRKVIVE